MRHDVLQQVILISLWQLGGFEEWIKYISCRQRIQSCIQSRSSATSNRENKWLQRVIEGFQRYRIVSDYSKISVLSTVQQLLPGPVPYLHMCPWQHDPALCEHRFGSWNIFLQQGLQLDEAIKRGYGSWYSTIGISSIDVAHSCHRWIRPWS